MGGWSAAAFVGAAIALGDRGRAAKQRVVVLDEGDVAHRASAAPITSPLVWVQRQGAQGSQDTRPGPSGPRSRWPGLEAGTLKKDHRIDVESRVGAASHWRSCEAELGGRVLAPESACTNQPNLWSLTPMRTWTRATLRKRVAADRRRSRGGGGGRQLLPIDGQWPIRCGCLYGLPYRAMRPRAGGVPAEPLSCRRSDYHNSVLPAPTSSTRSARRRSCWRPGIGKKRAGWLPWRVSEGRPVRPQRGHFVG